MNSNETLTLQENTAEQRHLHPVDPVRGGAPQQTVPDAEPIRVENRLELHEDLEGVNTRGESERQEVHFLNERNRRARRPVRTLLRRGKKFFTDRIVFRVILSSLISLQVMFLIRMISDSFWIGCCIKKQEVNIHYAVF